ncbi:MAG TPA: hypothetical protein VN806_13030 [Caulobacteraceae bacterium]|nr:hypothetical protein [Caulobacteraceae bacterium]
MEFAAWEGDDEALARGEAAAALREALGDLPAQLDRSPIAKLAAAGVRPMRPPRSGAEAVLLANDPAAARARLVATLNALSSLHEQLLNLAQEVTDQLDRIDGDTDLEPTLGASEGCGGDGTDWQRRPSQIRALQDAAQQAGASWAAQDECEHDADFEPEEDEEEHDGREPSLGWRPTVDQSPAELALGAFDGDREEASEDEGVPPYQSGRRQP